MAVGRAADYADQTPEIWAKRLYIEAQRLTFWHRMEGPEGSGAPLIRKDELLDKPGDTIRTDIVLALTGAGGTGDATFTEGNEEELRMRQTSFSPTLLRHGVAWTELAEAVNLHSLRGSAQRVLSRWMAGELDDRVWNELTGAGTTIPTKNKWFCGTATSRDTVADTNAGGRFTLDTLTELKAYAQVEIKIEPIRIANDEEVFVLAAHPYAIMSLKRDDTKWAQAQREAQIRGGDNPLFTGAVGMWDGVVIKSSQRVPRSANANSPAIQVADNVFLGAQAASRGYGFYPKFVEEEFSYGEKLGIATRAYVGEKLNVFDLTAAGGASAADLTAIGSIVVHSAAVAPTQ